MCTAGTFGLCRCAISEMPTPRSADRRGAGNLRAEFGGEFAVHRRAMHADLFEQPSAHHRHQALAAGLAGVVGAVPAVRTQATRAAGISACRRASSAARRPGKYRRASASNQLRAPRLAILDHGHVHLRRLTLRAEISAALVATVAVDAHPRDPPAC